jgi:phosphatidate cytidylyltransferase
VLLPRLLTALVGIPLALAIIYAGGWWLATAAALLAALALREFYQLAEAAADGDPRRSGGVPPAALRAERGIGYLLAVVIPATALAGSGSALAELALGMAAALAVIFGIADRAGRARVAAGHLGLPVGALALPALFSFLVHLRLLGTMPPDAPLVRLPPGACWLFLVFAACWATDTAAYGVGRAWGRHKLWPAVSPGKTIEGSVGGVVASIIVVAGFGRLFGLEVYSGVLLGALLGVAGQLGDLAESKLKRLAGVKDSGSLLPGHGGVLDRFDSLLVNAPLAYYFLRAALWG